MAATDTSLYFQGFQKRHKMASYSNFAFYYDELISNVNYSTLCDKLLKLLKHYNHTPGLTLDLACGTGSLTLELNKRGIDAYGVDASMEMLTIAKNKAYEQDLDILFLCQKMQNLDLYGSVDTVLCTLDSINHLKNAAEVQKTFDRVYMFLNLGGYFVFDINTIYKHRHVLADNVYVFETETVFCTWQNNYIYKDNSVNITLDFFEKQGKNYIRSSENFSEQAYSTEEIHKMLKKSGFTDTACFDAESFSEIKRNSERILFAAKK